MDIVLDSVCISSLLRTRRPDRVVDDLTKRIERHLVRVIVDGDGGIVSEWEETCNRELVHALIAKWESVRGFESCRKLGKIPADLKNKLRQLGFADTVDIVILRVALVVTDRTIISDDSDFWDPADPTSIGRRNAPVARLLRDAEEVEVLPLRGLLDRVRVYP